MMTKSTDTRAELIGRLSARSQEFTTGMAHLQQLIAARSGLNITDARAVALLAQHGPMTAGALQRRLHLTGGAATTAVDRLIQKGLAHRAPDLSDRRKVLVVLNERTLDTPRETYQAIEHGFHDVLRHYSDEELAVMARLLDDLILLAEQQATELTPNSPTSAGLSQGT